MTRLCLKMHLIASHCIFISEIFSGGGGGGMPPEPPGSLWRAHSGLLPQTKKQNILDRTLAGA